MHAASAAALPPEIARADRFIPLLSAYAVDVLLRRKELQAERARLLAAEYLLDMSERRLFRELGYSSVMHYGTHALGLSPRDVWDRLRVARALRQLPGVGAALRRGWLSWSKLREVIRVATPETEGEWLERSSHVGSRPEPRPSRYIPQSVLKKVHWRDEGRCQVPGCLNGRWSQLHHIRFFSRGGRHRARNLLTLCTQHHRQLHEGGISFCGRGMPRGTRLRTVGGRCCSHATPIAPKPAVPRGSCSALTSIGSASCGGSTETAATTSGALSMRLPRMSLMKPGNFSLPHVEVLDGLLDDLGDFLVVAPDIRLGRLRLPG